MCSFPLYNLSFKVNGSPGKVLASRLINVDSSDCVGSHSDFARVLSLTRRHPAQKVYHTAPLLLLFLSLRYPGINLHWSGCLYALTLKGG